MSILNNSALIRSFFPRDGLILWLDAELSNKWQDSSRTISAVSDADPVGAWDDLSGNGHHVIQPTDAARPTLKLAIQNGRSVIRFASASSQFLRKSSGFATVLQPLTYFTAGNFGGELQVHIDCNSAAEVAFYRQAGTDYTMHAGASVNGGFTADTSWHVFGALFNQTLSHLHVDQSAGSAIGPGSNTIATDCYVGCTTAGALFLNGDLGTVLIYNHIPAANVITRIETYLKNRWGTP